MKDIYRKYINIKELIIPKEKVEKIVQLMENYRPSEKKYNINKLCKYNIITYENLLDKNGEEGFFTDILPYCLMLQKEKNKPIFAENSSHELIHGIQSEMYKYMDSLPETEKILMEIYKDERIVYTQKWEEQMAFDLQQDVSNIIYTDICKSKVIMRGHEKIERYISENQKQKKLYDNIWEEVFAAEEKDKNNPMKKEIDNKLSSYLFSDPLDDNKNKYKYKFYHDRFVKNDIEM